MNSNGLSYNTGIVCSVLRPDCIIDSSDSKVVAFDSCALGCISSRIIMEVSFYSLPDL